MATRQVRIFAPPTIPYDGNTWAETVVGRVVRPMVELSDKLNWFWFSRYISHQGESSDCDVSKVPDDYFINETHRSLRFRYQMPDEDIESFERDSGELIRRQGCEFSDWMDYGFPGEFGGGRFLGGAESQERSEERATLMAQYVMSVSKLVIHALVGPDQEGRYSPEHNGHEENPLQSSFESMHHLFCNISSVPMNVEIYASSQTVFVRSAWSQTPPPAFQFIGKQPIKF